MAYTKEQLRERRKALESRLKTAKAAHHKHAAFLTQLERTIDKLRPKMRKGGGRAKGNSFERHVAKMICKAFGLSAEHCYRTPLSGGHRYASKKDPGDMQMSWQLRELFPFCVECKSYKRVDWYALLCPVGSKGQIGEWWKQATAAAADGVEPLLVFKQNSSEIFCMFRAYEETTQIGFPSVATHQTGDRIDDLRICRFEQFLEYYVCKEKLRKQDAKDSYKMA